MDIGRKLGFGFLVMLMGMIIVFIGLIILIGAVNLMGRLLRRLGITKANGVSESAAALVESAYETVSLPVAAAGKVLENNAGGELALVAGLAAMAVSAADTGKKYVVKAIRRVDAGSWN